MHTFPFWDILCKIFLIEERENGEEEEITQAKKRFSPWTHGKKRGKEKWVGKHKVGKLWKAPIKDKMLIKQGNGLIIISSFHYNFWIGRNITILRKSGENSSLGPRMQFGDHFLAFDLMVHLKTHYFKFGDKKIIFIGFPFIFWVIEKKERESFLLSNTPITLTGCSLALRKIRASWRNNLAPRMWEYHVEDLLSNDSYP